ncbi:virion core protein, T7 gp14 family [Magnetospirillum molischianum]|uniref:Uncharacterized protein n=1 Tax=Magnetospirillum molischianum DSM 120 TaxID=1150626 RepID=H8FP74_MAGML|nr:hypothetical protein [Magnetospirillum molischianum]CCG40162.1 exported hypothetical protein [Magnetospirillum molischianum DSM 120]
MGITASAVAIGALALSAIGTGMSVYGQIQQGEQQKKMADYQAAVGEQNAKISDRAAQDAEERGRVAEQQQRLKTSQTIGTQRSALASSGVQVDSGSALDVVSDSSMLGEMDALTVRQNAEREAYQYKVQAYSSRTQSGMSTLAGKNAASNAAWGAGSTLIGGLGSVAMTGAKLNSLGAFGSGTTTFSGSNKVSSGLTDNQILNGWGGKSVSGLSITRR